MTIAGPKLNYAPPPPPLRRRRTRRMLVASAVAVALVSAYWWAPGVWRQARLWYWQRQCANYVAPDDRVVYEDDPDKAKVLAGAGGYRFWTGDTPTYSYAAAAYPPC